MEIVAGPRGRLRAAAGGFAEGPREAAARKMAAAPADESGRCSAHYMPYSLSHYCRHACGNTLATFELECTFHGVVLYPPQACDYRNHRVACVSRCQAAGSDSVQGRRRPGDVREAADAQSQTPRAAEVAFGGATRHTYSV